MSSALQYANDVSLFEVSTLSSDTLRARLAVGGALTGETAPLLASAIATHLSAGRRHLRLDVSTVCDVDAGGLETLTSLHGLAHSAGGVLIFEGAVSGAPLGDHVATLRHEN